jgi:hypothetical protein
MGAAAATDNVRASIDAAHDEQERLEQEALERQANGTAGLEARKEPAAAPEPPVEELRVDGTTQLGMIDFGGKKPTSASLRLVGGAVKLVEGKAYQKGDVIHFEGTAVVNDVGGKDTHDPKTGIVVSCKQVHVARILDVRVEGAEG